MELKELSSKLLFEGPIFSISRRKYQLPDSRQADYDILSHHGAVTILPLDKENQVWFVRQFRPAAGQMLLEIPAGTIDREERPEACAQRELREEIGMGAGKLQMIGEFYLAPGYSTEYQYIFLATELSPEKLPADEDEILFTEKYKLEEVYEMIYRGAIIDAKTIAALMLAKPFLPASK